MVNISAALAAHKQLVESIRALYPDEDEASLADTIEGASDLDSAILATLRDALWREAQADALQGMIEKLKGRKLRLETAADHERAAALNAMQEAGLPKLWAADMSVSISAGQAKVVITDETIIPDHFMRVKREPDKRAIGEQLKHGGEVAGCTLSNPQPALRIRRD